MALFDYDSERRASARYQAKRGVVRDFWIGVGVFMLIVSNPIAIVILALASTFASFMILDETQ